MSEAIVHDWLQTGATVAGALGVVSGGFWALLEYRKSQAWKRAEFTAELMKEFFASEGVRTAQMILWSDPKVPLLPGQPPREVPAKLLESALAKHTGRGPFTDEELAIRRSFDSLLSRLVTLDRHVQTGLLDAEDVAPYLRFTCEILLGTDAQGKREPATQRALETYEDFNRFHGALDLAALVCAVPERRRRRPRIRAAGA